MQWHGFKPWLGYQEIPDQGTEIPHNVRYSQKKKKKEEEEEKRLNITVLEPQNN